MSEAVDLKDKDKISVCCPPGSLDSPDESLDFPLFDDTYDRPSTKLRGTFVTLHGTTARGDLPCYYVGPLGDSASTKLGLILYPDVWGMKSRILQIADWLAQGSINQEEANGGSRGTTTPKTTKRHPGHHVLVCDCFRGHTRDDHPYGDMLKWFETLPYDHVVKDDTRLARDFLKSNHQVSALAAIGFCWGAWAIAKTCIDFDWKAVVAPHPSYRVESAVFQGNSIKLMQDIPFPLFLLPAGNDPEYTKPASPEFQALVASRTSPSSCQSVVFETMVHGWMTRGNMQDPMLLKAVRDGLVAIRRFLHCFLT